MSPDEPLRAPQPIGANQVSLAPTIIGEASPQDLLIDGVPLKDLYCLEVACERYPGKSRENPMNRSVMHRLVRDGNRDAIRLKAVRVPSIGLMTCDAWIASFVRDIAAREAAKAAGGV